MKRKFFTLVAAIRVSVGTQAFCLAQTSVYFNRKIARNPLLLLHSTVTGKTTATSNISINTKKVVTLRI